MMYKWCFLRECLPQIWEHYQVFTVSLVEIHVGLAQPYVQIQERHIGHRSCLHGSNSSVPILCPITYHSDKKFSWERKGAKLRDRERGKIRKGRVKETGTCKRLKTGGRDTNAIKGRQVVSSLSLPLMHGLWIYNWKCKKLFLLAVVQSSRVAEIIVKASLHVEKSWLVDILQSSNENALIP